MRLLVSKCIGDFEGEVAGMALTYRSVHALSKR